MLLPDVNVRLAGSGPITSTISRRERSSTRRARDADLCRRLRLRGNLVPDAYLVAPALEQRAELVTFDRGFGRYPRLRWRCLLDD